MSCRGLSGAGEDDQSEEGNIVEAEVVREDGPLVRSGDSLQPIKVPDVFPEVCLLYKFSQIVGTRLTILGPRGDRNF